MSERKGRLSIRRLLRLGKDTGRRRMVRQLVGGMLNVEIVIKKNSIAGLVPQCCYMFLEFIILKISTNR